jgi:nitrite reductase/ring-hydroxylating ferredoxin subunit
LRQRHADTRDWITTASKALGLESALRLVEPHRFQAILERIIAERTTLDRDAISALWWWESLREPFSYLQPADPIACIESLLQGDESVWFVAEDGSKKTGNFWLYEGTVTAICAVLRECPHFDYYFVAKKMDWLVCENHHAFVIASGEPVASALSALRVRAG